jgi:integrase
MASVFRQKYKRPIPPDATVTINRKQIKVARWTDSRGRKRVAPLSEDGTAIVLEYRNWYYSYTGPSGRVTEKGLPDKELTKQLAAKEEVEARKRAAGLVTFDPHRAGKPINEAIDSWVADLGRRGTSEAYRYNVRLLLNQMATGCGWRTLAAIRSDTLSAWLASPERVHRRGKSKGKPLSARSLNQYLETARTFVDWCCGQRPPWLESNPLRAVQPACEAVKVREKRALTLEEMARLERAAGNRWPIYLTAALTGLRRSELKRLQWGDIRLDADRPFIQLRAGATKARRADVVPINAELLVVLKRLCPDNVRADQRVFPRIPKYATYKKDVTVRACIPWRDDQNRLASFHALRKTFGTYLAIANVPMRTAMDLMRVTDAKLLNGVYTDARLLNSAAAAATLPKIGVLRDEFGVTNAGLDVSASPQPRSDGR